MTLRTYLYSTLTENALLVPLVAGRVFPKKSMSSSVEDHPFVVYKLGNDTNEGLGDTNSPHRQYFQIYVHDVNINGLGDYTLIDQVLGVIKDLLDGASSGADEVITIRYLETSQDLDDETLNTVFRYARFQAIIGKAE